jgi:hypothetical protein
MNSRWPVVIYVKNYFAALPLAGLFTQTGRNIADGVKYIFIMVENLVHVAGWH